MHPAVRRAAQAVPVLVSLAMVVTACGSGGSDSVPVAQAPVAAAVPAPEQKPAAAPATAATKAAQAKAIVAKSAAEKVRTTKAATQSVEAPAAKEAPKSASNSTADEQIYEAKQGVTDVGISKDTIKLGSINMHGMALGNLATLPIVRGNLATASAINDRGGVLGRRLRITDCDDGPGEVSRAKACIKKLVVQDKVFSLVTGVDWATASIHDDLKQYKLPYVGAWAYSQTEWQDPYMFPTHMSMIHEAMAGANWTRNVIKPKTYGLICLTSPEMQLACNEVRKILDASGAKLVKKADVPISETSMSTHVLAMRAANPEHIIHYVINPATIIKFMTEATQQNYYPSKGISGNHLAAEVLGSLFGKAPVGRYWTNTTYRMWGSEFMATMNKYAPANRGLNYHIVQSSYVGLNIFAQAAKAVGPNLTRERLIARLGNGVWQTDASLDQKFSYVASERHGADWNKQYAQGREFMYKYSSTNTMSNPDGSPNGWDADPDQFVIYTWK